MENIFDNETKRIFFAKIQNSLYNLKVNSPDYDIQNIINQIPNNYLNQKEDLMLICCLFSYYTRNNLIKCKRNGIKLFEKIIIPIKKHMPNESTFLWKIFGGLNYFKLWMYEEGLISINTIIQKIRNKSLYIVEYFFPEIIEKDPELYEKEIKPQLDKQYTEKDIIEFKELRKKHFKWLRDSNDFLDPLYKEIETNKLRLALKTDDIDSFQKILSNQNLSVDLKISESVIENFLIVPHKISLLEFAATFNSIKIFKFLIMNDATIPIRTIYCSITQRNYEIFHIVESAHLNRVDQFYYSSILSWNNEIYEYVLNNYDFITLEQDDLNTENDENLIQVFEMICISYNFEYFNSIYLPFLRKNPLFVKRNIYPLLDKSFLDISGYFTSELLKYPGIDINSSEMNNDPLIINAIRKENINVVGMFLNNPLFDVNSHGNGNYHPLIYVCSLHSEIRMLDMFCKHPKINIDLKSHVFNVTAFQMSVTRGNTYAIDYFVMNSLVNLTQDSLNVLFFYCIANKLFYSFRITLKHFLSKNGKCKTINEIVGCFERTATVLNGFKNEFIDIFKNAIKELRQKDLKLSLNELLKLKNTKYNQKRKSGRIIYRPNVNKK